jgi:hypothetical protein
MPPVKKKGITISLTGTEVPVYLPDESVVKIKLTPNTTAGAAIIAVRNHVSISSGSRTARMLWHCSEV